MIIILASGAFETLFVDGLGDDDAPLILTARCNFCGHEETSRWERDDVLPAMLIEDGREEGEKTAEAMVIHMLEKHPEKLVSDGL